MKIAILTPGGVDRSGTGKVIPCLLALIERLARRGHEVHVFAAAQEPEPGQWPLLGATVRNAGRAPFDVVHAFWARYGAVAALLRLIIRVPVVLTLPGGDVTDLREIGYGSLISRRGRLGLHLAAAAAGAINTPCRFMQALAAAEGIEAEVLPLGADRAAFPPALPRRRAAEQRCASSMLPASIG